ncbi:MAG: BRO family protein [Clostridia bacterium]
MNNLKIFENKEFGKIRIINKENEIYFVTNDICKILNLTNITETLKRVDLDDLSITEVEDTLGRKQVSTIVNESVRVTTTTKVTGKGQIYFINKYLSKEAKIYG